MDFTGAEYEALLRILRDRIALLRKEGKRSPKKAAVLEAERDAMLTLRERFRSALFHRTV
jgi:hypothetical protein